MEPPNQRHRETHACKRIRSVTYGRILHGAAKDPRGREPVMDGDSGPGVLGQAGYAITGSGGGGAGGRYVFASLAELDGMIADWEALRDRIFARDAKFRQAIGLIAPPAEDIMSRLHAHTAVQSLK